MENGANDKDSPQVPDSPMPNPDRIKIAVIGAGPSGLMVLNSLNNILVKGAQGDKTAPKIVCFERSPVLGGLWYIPPPQWDEEEELPVTGIYPRMRTNIPCELMDCPPDLIFSKENSSSFQNWWTVSSSLTEFAEKQQLHKFVRFRASVDRVMEHPTKVNKFLVMSTNRKTGIEKGETFDKVIICTGQHSEHFIPDIPGLQTFPGAVIHTKFYKDPSIAEGKRVLVVGSSWSAIDASIQSCNNNVAYLRVSYRDPAPCMRNYKWDGNVVQNPSLPVCITGETVIFEDGSSEQFDIILFATGYRYHFPMMSEDLLFPCAFHATLAPALYRQTVLPTNPGIFYMGMQTLIFTFPLFRIQAEYIARVISGDIRLPESIDQLFEEIDASKKKRNELEPTIENLVKFQFEFLKQLEEDMGTDYLPGTEHLEHFLSLFQYQNINVMKYRDHKFKAIQIP